MKVDLQKVKSQTNRVLSRSFEAAMSRFGDEVGGVVLDGRVPYKANVLLMKSCGNDKIWVRIRWTGAHHPWVEGSEVAMKKLIWEAGARAGLVMCYISNGWFQVVMGGNLGAEGCWQ